MKIVMIFMMEWANLLVMSSQLAATDQVDFEVSNFVSTLANNTIIQKIYWLLKFYKSNSTSTNHYIACCGKFVMIWSFHKCYISKDWKHFIFLSLLKSYNLVTYQVHVFLSKFCRCHSQIHSTISWISRIQVHERNMKMIVLFLTSLVRRMLRKMKSQRLLFVEVLYWKTRKECHFINLNIARSSQLEKESKKWTIIQLSKCIQLLLCSW